MSKVCSLLDTGPETSRFMTEFGGRRAQRMWTARSEKLADARGLRFAVALDSHSATVADVLRAWQGDAGFRSLFNALLADAPHTAFRWETPAVTAATVSQPFEFVLLDTPDLDRSPDPEAFAGHFLRADASVTVFLNSGGDAIMVVPCPVADPTAYGHLAAFAGTRRRFSVTLFGSRSARRWRGGLGSSRFG